MACIFRWHKGVVGKYSMCSYLIGFLAIKGRSTHKLNHFVQLLSQLQPCPPIALCCSQVGCFYFQNAPQEQHLLLKWKPNRQCVWVVTDTLVEWAICPIWWCVFVHITLFCILTVLGSMHSAAFVMPSKHFPTMGSTWRSTSANVFMHTPNLSILFSSMSWSFYNKSGVLKMIHCESGVKLPERAVISYWDLTCHLGNLSRPSHLFKCLAPLSKKQH